MAAVGMLTVLVRPLVMIAAVISMAGLLTECVVANTFGAILFGLMSACSWYLIKCVDELDERMMI